MGFFCGGGGEWCGKGLGWIRRRRNIRKVGLEGKGGGGVKGLGWIRRRRNIRKGWSGGGRGREIAFCGGGEGGKGISLTAQG